MSRMGLLPLRLYSELHLPIASTSANLLDVDVINNNDVLEVMESLFKHNKNQTHPDFLSCSLLHLNLHSLFLDLASAPNILALRLLEERCRNLKTSICYRSLIEKKSLRHTKSTSNPLFDLLESGHFSGSPLGGNKLIGNY